MALRFAARVCSLSSQLKNDLVPAFKSPRAALKPGVTTLLAGLLALPGLASASRLVTDETGRQVRLPDRPVRLVSLAPSVTETLYALGLDQEIVGDTDYCDYPPAAKLKPHVGSLLNPSLEKIVALKP